jgi:type IV secretory pathway VirD2 relaxase
MKNDTEPEFRLRPHRPRIRGKSEATVWSVALKTVFRYASMSTRKGGVQTQRPKAARSQFNQRCAVRITYTKNKVAGQWRAHGRYIARESAAHEEAPGFSAQSTSTEPSAILDKWQKQGDARIWKFIVSPEFGDRVDLQRLTRDLMKNMERDLGSHLEWVAVNHFNTDHPHTHVALRGIRDDGSTLDLPRDYVKSGIRRTAEDLCTRQLGYRTRLDAREAESRQVEQCRVTSLDKIIERSNPAPGQNSTFSFAPSLSMKLDQRDLVGARLITLQKMGLASGTQSGEWEIRADFVTVLKAMQELADRQKTLSAHRSLISDERLPVVVTEPGSITRLDGRVLGHGEDETGKNFGRHFMLLEGTDAQIHLIYYTPELEEARSRGQLGTNSFIKLRKRFEHGRRTLELTNLGDADELLKKEDVLRHLRVNATSATTTWAGWLGRYQARVRAAVERTVPKSVCDYTR